MLKDLYTLFVETIPSAKGAMFFAKGNMLSAKATMLSAKGNILSANALMALKEAFMPLVRAIIFNAKNILITNTANILFAKGFREMCVLIG